MRSRAMLVAGLAAAALAVAPAAASATRYYAAPNGDGPSPCLRSDPCSLDDALQSSGSSNDAFLLGGTYQVNDGVQPNPDAYIHGPRRGKPAKLVSNASTTLFSVYGVHLSDLIVVNTAGQALATQSSPSDTTRVERLRVFANTDSANAGACFVAPGDTSFTRDTLCVNNGDGPALVYSVGAGALFTPTVRLAHVTAVARGDAAQSYGMFFEAGQLADYTVKVTNSIAIGSTTAGGITAQDQGGSSHVTVRVDHTNFRKPTATAGSLVDIRTGNQTSRKPRFLDAAHKDYHQLPSSPTVNAGTASNGFVGLGSFDFEGEKRKFGAKPDIGADEFQGLLDLKAGKRQRAGKLKVRARCPLTSCNLKATAKTNDGGKDTARKRAPRGTFKPLRLDLSGHQGKAKVTVKMRGKAGTRKTKRVRIKLR